MSTVLLSCDGHMASLQGVEREQLLIMPVSAKQPIFKCKVVDDAHVGCRLF